MKSLHYHTNMQKSPGQLNTEQDLLDQDNLTQGDSQTQPQGQIGENLPTLIQLSSHIQHSNL